MAVIRGIRAPEAIFYSYFKNIDIKFIYLSQKPAFYPINLQNLEMVNLLFKPKYLLDPIAVVNGGHYNHRSWAEIEGVESELDDCDIVCLTDTFYVWNKTISEMVERKNKRLVTVVWESIKSHPSVFLPPYSSSVKAVVRNTDLFIARSKLASNFIKSRGVSNKKVKVIYKGIDLKKFFPGKSRKSSFPVRILYVGQLTKSKGVDDLLSAFALLTKEVPHVELIIAGSGPLEVKINDMATSYPISYLGFVDYDTLQNIYREADIFCSVSKEIRYFGIKVWEELFSYTLMEALGSGLPIVATRSGGIPEEIGEDNFLVPPGNAKELFRALVSLSKNLDLRRNLGSKNRKRAEKMFDIVVQAKKTEDAILSILK